MKQHVIFTSALLFLGIASLAGCATPHGPGTIHSSQMNRKQTVEAGTVTAVRDVTIQSDGSTVGTVTGAALGGLAGSTVGGGRGQTAATIGGAAAGAAAGNAVSSSSKPGVEVTVQLDAGRTVAVVQPGSSNEFRVGDRVNVASDGVTTRVTR